MFKNAPRCVVDYIERGKLASSAIQISEDAKAAGNKFIVALADAVADNISVGHVGLSLVYTGPDVTCKTDVALIYQELLAKRGEGIHTLMAVRFLKGLPEVQSNQLYYDRQPDSCYYLASYIANNISKVLMKDWTANANLLPVMEFAKSFENELCDVFPVSSNEGDWFGAIIRLVTGKVLEVRIYTEALKVIV